MATHYHILAWEILWTEGLAGSSPWHHKRAGYDSVTKPLPLGMAVFGVVPRCTRPALARVWLRAFTEQVRQSLPSDKSGLPPL